jgi:phosphoribosylanthranilate isomerase
MQPKIKVCGLTDLTNINEIIALKPDYIGFIFWEKSKKFL